MLDGVSALGCRAGLIDGVVMALKAKQNLEAKTTLEITPVHQDTNTTLSSIPRRLFKVCPILTIDSCGLASQSHIEILSPCKGTYEYYVILFEKI